MPSGVDYCTARICGGGGGGGDSGTPTAGANSEVSCVDGTFTGVGSDWVRASYMGAAATCRSGRESSGQSAFSLAVNMATVTWARFLLRSMSSESILYPERP